jgi:hypothetical protein
VIHFLAESQPQLIQLSQEDQMSVFEERVDTVTSAIKSVVNSSVGRVLSFSHEGPRFKSRCRHLFISLLFCDLIDC